VAIVAQDVNRAAGHGSPWPVVLRGGAALAMSMGIGRFVYTPILPLMVDEAGLSRSSGATLATANYGGYLLGALLGVLVPALVRSTAVLRMSVVALIASLALMPISTAVPVWFVLRFAAGAASALVFVIAVSAMLVQLRGHAQQLVGWAFGGIGVGIALSGLLVLLVRSTSTWRAAWWASAALAAALTVAAWTLRPEPAGAATAMQQHGDTQRTRRWFAALFTAYSLEGVGYIIAGTFLVAAIGENSPGWIGSGAWVLVGLCAIPASAGWAMLARRRSRPTLLAVALFVQAVGIALPGLVGGVVPALVSAALFGATFLSVASLVLAVGAHLQTQHAVAILTTGYSVGQLLGPLIAKPMLHNGYRVALLVGALIVLAAAAAAATLRARFPHRVGTMVEPSRAGTP